MPEAIQFIATRDKIIREVNKHFNNLLPKIDTELSAPQMATFGDSVIFCWNVEHELKFKTIHLVDIWLRSFYYRSFLSNLFFRGNVSFGKYVFDENSHTALDTAVSDAASWYEETNWTGIMATPMCSFIIDTNKEFMKHQKEVTG
ncbi:MAG: hypothetical protein JSS67_11150 [Bacteroidetes bacterium]|nr:hypothetical protein [Bacteroidota bacterium]